MQINSIDSTILASLIAPDEPSMSAAAARELLNLRFGDRDRERMHDLAEKARAGVLTAEEQAWADGYGRIGSLLGLLQSKARISLRRHAGNAEE